MSQSLQDLMFLSRGGRDLGVAFQSGIRGGRVTIRSDGVSYVKRNICACTSVSVRPMERNPGSGQSWAAAFHGWNIRLPLRFGFRPQGPCRVGTGESGLVLSEEVCSAPRPPSCVSAPPPHLSHQDACDGTEGPPGVNWERPPSSGFVPSAHRPRPLLNLSYRA